MLEHPVSTSHLSTELGGGGRGAVRDAPTKPKNDGGGSRANDSGKIAATEGVKMSSQSDVGGSSSQSDVAGSRSDVGGSTYTAGTALTTPTAGCSWSVSWFKVETFAARDIRCDSKHAPRCRGHERCSCRQVSKSSGFEIEVETGRDVAQKRGEGKFSAELLKKHSVPAAASWRWRVWW